MSNITKNFKAKARGLGMIHGKKSAGDNIPVKVSADEAILPKGTVRALGGSRGVAHLIKKTTGKMPTGIRAGSHHILGGVPTDDVAARQAAALDDTLKVNTRAANAAQDFKASQGMPEVLERQGVAARQAEMTANSTAKIAADFRAAPAPVVDQFGIPSNRTVPASPAAAAIDYKPAAAPAAPVAQPAGLQLVPQDNIPYSKPSAVAPTPLPPAGMTADAVDAPRTLRNTSTKQRVAMFEAPVAPQPMPGRPPITNATIAAQPAVQPTPVEAAPKLQPIAPDIVAPAPAAEPARTGIRGMFDKGVAAAKGMLPNSTAPGAPAKPNAVVTGENIGAATAGQLKPGSGMARLGAADFALRSGSHWDATGGADDSERGGIGIVDKGQIALRDLLGTGASTVGGVAGGGVGAIVGSPAGKLGRVGGALTGGIIGATKANELADGVMGGVRRGLNAANGAMGGDPEYWKDSDALINKQNDFLKQQPGYKESAIQRGSKATTAAIGKALTAVGITGDATGAAAAPTRAPEVQAALDSQAAAAKGQQAPAPAATAVAPAAAPQNTPVDGAAIMNNTGAVASGTGAIRNLRTGAITTIDSRPSPAQQAAQAKAAAGPDMSTSQGVLAQAQKLMGSSNTDDRVMAAKLMRHAYPQMLQSESSKYTADSTRAASRATLMNDLRKNRGEGVLKQMDNEMGPPMLEKGVPNEPRQKFESSLRNTLGEAGFDIHDLTPKDMQEFKVAYQAASESEPGLAKQLYMNWIQSRPFVRDSNPHRQVARAPGKAGETGPLNHYQNANGWEVYEPSAAGKKFWTGSYDKNAADLINRK
jgi:hypothetical protein